MSAPLRYARILNGLSVLISRRSAISRSIRAIARLSNPQAFHLDMVVEHSSASGGERRGHRRSRLRRAVTEETAAAARAADLGGRRARGGGAADQLVDRRSRNARRQPFAVVPFRGDLTPDA